MVKSHTSIFTAFSLPIPEELESGTYSYVYHGSKSEFQNIEEFKAKVKRRWELEEGLTVLSVDILQIPAGQVIPTENMIWHDGELAKIEEDHTALVVKFKIDSPFPFVLLIILAIFVVVAIIAYLISGIFEKFVELVYKEPLIGLGIIAVLFVFGLALAGVKIPKIKREEERR